jgi:hypothetical protein
MTTRMRLDTAGPGRQVDPSKSGDRSKPAAPGPHPRRFYVSPIGQLAARCRPLRAPEGST